MNENASALFDKTGGLVNTFHPPRSVILVSRGTIDQDHVPFGLSDVGWKVHCQLSRRVDQLHRLGERSPIFYEVRLQERILAADPAEPVLLILNEDSPPALVQLEPKGRIISHAEDEKIHRGPDGAGNEEDFICMHLDSELLPHTLNPLQLDTLHLTARRR